ncbi:MAG: hypothetical protein A3B34_03650 [Candidatus Sungbacteria bacterium RIFCSPLOWO2_01_FULL_54_21]|uniref:Type II secretion system protein GspG C-terminal domain-containing protein n=2 Tax=Candidatus Sungiibacteriota TaxID=1817917 RepID=A0A1G2L9L5_9BACT|nr:MAG: hypothetical protein A3C92_02495 [Candidatus Sungbacteria bacterium RIFCSPHIGHO2_02_FULL_53_17]OHA07479.1 MAG: hypothetical protein A3B34_03650 [Candidatus Sungbacteria bacterium RIFCSPLOWO2_01_FULL_54_21]
MIMKILSAKSRRGFTLIELLVVISIISLLSSVVLTSVNSARSKARDARRVADFHQIELALDLYLDKYGVYPGPASGVCNPGENAHGDGWCRDMRNNDGATPIQNWIPGLQEFLPSMPHNPKPYSPRGPWPYHYCLGGNPCVGSGTNQQYWLFTSLENDTQRTCGGGTVYLWWGGQNTCSWWGAGLYVVKNF